MRISAWITGAAWCALTGALAQGAALAAQDPFVHHGSLDRAFAVADESPEAVAHYRALHPNEDTAVLDAALARIFPGGKPETAEETALRIMAYVTATTRLEFSAAPLGSTVLKEGHAYCNGMALAFVSLCRRAGMPARINALHNLEWMQAHNMAEAHYDGAWRLFDPTYGVFKYSRGEYDGEGAIPSFRTAMTDPGLQDNLFAVVETRWRGEYDPESFAVRPVDRGKRVPGGFTLPDFYAQALGKGFPAVVTENAAHSYPIDVDLREENAVWIGARDNGTESMYGRREDRTYPRYYGVPFIGKTRLGAAFHTFTLRTAEPGLYRMTYHLIGQGRHQHMDAVELRGVVVRDKAHTDDTWRLDFFVQEDPALLLVANRYFVAYIDAIRIERLDEAD